MVLEYLSGIADTIAEKIVTPDPATLMKLVQCNEIAHRTVLDCLIQEHTEHQLRFKDIGTVSRRELVVRGLKNVGLGDVANDINHGVLDLCKRLREFEIKWCSTIKINGVIVDQKLQAGDRYAGSAADYLRRASDSYVNAACDEWAEVICEAETVISIIRQLVIDRRQRQEAANAKRLPTRRSKSLRVRKCAIRDAAFARLADDGKTAKEIAATWNDEHYEDQVSEETVRQGIRRFRKGTQEIRDKT
jgi:hypothetical protein